ncbi:hypothetical protein [Streptomyces spectabilis]|uniref:Uncharacterized protein n=1 Tax=Streptomyces spectabilis TaxID=68270 RepID=A0A7W8B5C7_STRST|nr:hypothetical protein [Streptomyces spectabilis]MBB5108863.1 hypothetical protein [Streptomyces spectabilis]MCI3899839.1 hypothetical protein [Streptomyces spectabilis]GGV42594.1 hypothetical protein GCM10010245_66800 [Streptomyces spectabilis]
MIASPAPQPSWSPRRLCTARAGTASDISATTIRADLSRGRWPAPDPEGSADGANRWYGEDVTQALAGERGYRRGTNPSA